MDIKVSLPRSQDLIDYWKKRCQAAEALIEAFNQDPRPATLVEFQQKLKESKNNHPEYVTYEQAVILKNNNYEGKVQAYYRLLKGSNIIIFYETKNKFMSTELQEASDMWAAPLKSVLKGYNK